ncbi:MAG: cupin domain-containing protein [Bacteroidales bacterium]|nr:cupin domain-containing protein [Bacteroidales bacterium]MCF8389842.1 cupin domain-containing protein [Bacteroidales bacterium]
MTTFNTSEVYTLRDSVDYSNGATVSKIVSKNTAGNITLFAFDKGQSLSKHTAPFDAFIQILDGEAKIIIDDKAHDLSEGEGIIMPANISHAVEASERFKMLLVMIKG